MFYKRYNQLHLWSFNLNSLVLILGCFFKPAQLQNLALVIYGVSYLSSVPTQPFMFLSLTLTNVWIFILITK